MRNTKGQHRTLTRNLGIFVEDVLGSTSTTEYTTLTDTLMAVERGNRTYYCQDRSAVSIIGLENVQELVSYDMPETWLRFPMQRSDSISTHRVSDTL